MGEERREGVGKREGNWWAVKGSKDEEGGKRGRERGRSEVRVCGEIDAPRSHVAPTSHLSSGGTTTASLPDDRLYPCETSECIPARLQVHPCPTAYAAIGHWTVGLACSLRVLPFSCVLPRPLSVPSLL